MVRVAGTHGEVGHALGRACRTEAKVMDAAFRADLRAAGVGYEGALRQARRILPLVEEFHAGFLEEIQGYAEATGFTTEDILAQWSGYPTAKAPRGCTDVAVGPAVTQDGSVLAGHNEDYYVHYADAIVPVHVEPKGKPAFFALSYGGLFPTMGFNDRGISLTGNGLSPNDTRPGLPKMFPPRRVLEAENLVEALRFSMPPSRGDSFNNIVCSAEGELYSMEGSATAFAPIYGTEGYIVHTNHYLHPDMVRFEHDPHDNMSSVVRYNRALRLLKESLGSVTVKTIGSIFADHVGYPGGICRHPDPARPEAQRIQTNWSGVVDITHRTAWVCRGNPCTGTYLPYSLAT